MQEQAISQILMAYKEGILDLDECKSSITELISQSVQAEEPVTQLTRCSA